MNLEHQAEDLACRKRETRIAICCGDAVRSLAYERFLRDAGYALASRTTPENLRSSRIIPGLIDLLVCDAQSKDSFDWQTLNQIVDPKIGLIAVVDSEDPRYVINCIRQGALNCHLQSEESGELVEIVSECLERNLLGIGQIKTPAEKRRARIAAQLREAIADEIIDIEFQPIMNCDGWTCSRVECLARWTDKTLGSVTPYEFIRTAEDEDIVDELGLLILRKAMKAQQILEEKGFSLRYSINVSRRQFDNTRLVGNYLKILKEFNSDPRSIVLEITETAKCENNTLAISLMNDFLAAGFELAIDDFGTGESSFIQLSHVPYGELKLDRSLISCIFEKAGMSILESVIGMAKSLNMHLVAEGVEDQQTAGLLKYLDVDYCQGFFFARPMKLESLIAFLDQNKGRPGASRNYKGLN